MNKILKFYSRHRKLCLTTVSLIIIAIIFVIPDVAAAQAADPETTKLMNTVNELVNQVLKFSSALLWPVLLMIGSLLDNELIFGGAMGERLLGIWVQIRNLVNIAFVLVLLAVAAYNVLGIGEEGGPFALKQVLPKFVLALIAVNFSFLAIKVVLDFTNVITGAVFALPATASDAEFKREKIEDMICGTSSEEVPMKGLWCDEKKFNDRAKSMFSRLDRTNVALVYAIKFGNATQMKFIKDGLKDLGQLGFNILFNMLLYVVYALSFIVLFLVLLSRVVAMWIAVVLSPILALSIVVPQLKELAGGGGELQQKFVKGAIAPITIGLVLSVGYIMLDGFSADKSIHGTLLSSSTLSAIDPNSLPTGITDLQQLMVAVGIVVIVWTGVFGAAKDTVAGTVTEMIRSKAVDFGKWTAKLPTFLQAIPTGGKFGRKSMSLLDIGATITDVQQKTRGRSLFESAPPDKAIISDWRTAGYSSAKEFAKAFAKNPHILNTPEGWDVLKDTMVRHKKVKNGDEFDSVFGKSHHDYKLAAQKLLTLPQLNDFKEGLNATTEGQKLRNENQMIAAIEARPAEPITSVASASKAIGESGAQVKSTHPTNFAGLTSQQIKQLQKLPETFREKLLTWTADNKVKLTDGIGEGMLKGMADFTNELKTSDNPTQITNAINEARRNGVSDQHITQIVTAAEYKTDQMKQAAQTAIRPAATTGTPPPGGTLP